MTVWPEAPRQKDWPWLFCGSVIGSSNAFLYLLTAEGWARSLLSHWGSNWPELTNIFVLSSLSYKILFLLCVFLIGLYQLLGKYYSLFLVNAMGWIMPHPNSYVEVLTPSTSVCDCTWRQGISKENGIIWVDMNSNDSCP